MKKYCEPEDLRSSSLNFPRKIANRKTSVFLTQLSAEICEGQDFRKTTSHSGQVFISRNSIAM